MKIIKVNLGKRSYDIMIGKDILSNFDFTKLCSKKCAIITDSNTRKLYSENLENLLNSTGYDAKLLEFPAGEKSKTWEMAGKLGRKLAKEGFDRSSTIIAIGGGVTGDLAGFVASVYQRGIGFVQIPTTLLAHVDSSIGGKTGVDIPEGKNLLGTFHQPKAVIIDIKTLETLPEKEIRNGFAEIIKYGMISDKKLFSYLEANITIRPDGFYSHIIERSCRIKADIVEKDEREGELRKILNYGHTIGHAIEAYENFKISHGEAVALGMVYEAKIANMLGFLDKDSLKRQNKLIKAAGLPTEYNFRNPDKIIEIMRKDKKSKNGRLYFALPEQIGKIKKENNKTALPVDEKTVLKSFYKI